MPAEAFPYSPIGAASSRLDRDPGRERAVRLGWI